MAKRKKTKSKTTRKQIKGRQRKKAARKKTPSVSQRRKEEVQNAKAVATKELRKAGYNTIAKLAQAESQQLSKQTGFNRQLAEKIIFSAKSSYQKVDPKRPSREKETTVGRKQTIKKNFISMAIKKEEFRRRVVHYVVKGLF